jgi:iron complex transport system ATP-binding protein
MMFAYDMSGLTVCLDGNRVLGPLDLCVRQGEFFIVVGPNGSGKTTLLRTLAGLVRDFKGSLHIQGEDIYSIPPARLALTVSHLPQFSATDVPFTVEMAVMLGRAPQMGLMGLEKEQDIEAVQDAMRLTRVMHLRDRSLAKLSGGELKRVWIAQALCREPEILLLDEPTASLDPGHQMRIMDLLDDIRVRRGTTMIIISHDLNLASAYADRMLLLREGCSVAMGPPSEVLEEDHLARAYDWKLAVDLDPFTGKPRVTALPGKHRAGSVPVHKSWSP